ncbi:hypothetical protein [Sulfurimonas sp. HSL3-7]|uniref:hypothetical protein n=1 Tax=Sulfonitrofixus jiaomeiensis TaxID=3131938 RepID=UPI0031F96852
MTKLILNIIQMLIGIYWAGEVARQNKKVDDFVAQLEKGYQSFNQNLQETTISNGLIVLRKFYGWFAFVSLVMIFSMGALSIRNPELAYIFSLFLIGSCLSWFSIKWVTEHKKTISEIGPQAALFVFSPLLMGAFDFIFGTSFIPILTKSLANTSLPFGYEITQDMNPIVFSFMVTLLFVSVFAIYYLITWMLTTAIAFASTVVIAIPVLLARLIHIVWPKKAFFGFTVLIFAIVTIWQQLL